MWDLFFPHPLCIRCVLLYYLLQETGTAFGRKTVILAVMMQLEIRCAWWLSVQIPIVRGFPFILPLPSLFLSLRRSRWNSLAYAIGSGWFAWEKHRKYVKFDGKYIDVALSSVRRDRFIEDWLIERVCGGRGSEKDLPVFARWSTPVRFDFVNLFSRVVRVMKQRRRGLFFFCCWNVFPAHVDDRESIQDTLKQLPRWFSSLIDWYLAFCCERRVHWFHSSVLSRDRRQSNVFTFQEHSSFPRWCSSFFLSYLIRLIRFLLLLVIWSILTGDEHEHVYGRWTIGKRAATIPWYCSTDISLRTTAILRPESSTREHLHQGPTPCPGSIWHQGCSLLPWANEESQTVQWKQQNGLHIWVGERVIVGNHSFVARA